MKILHLDSNHDMIYEELSALGIENHVDLKSTKSEIENIISNYHGIVIRSRITIDKGFIEKAINLKFIARVGSGTENIDCEYLKEKKIELISSGEGNSNAVGEHALGLLLSLSKKITKSNTEMKNGIRKREENRGFEIEGKTIGLIGYGKTGKSFAKKLSGFNCNTIFIDIKRNLGDNYAREVKINELKEKIFVVAGGVAANKKIRSMLINLCEENDYRGIFPPIEFCGDNAAMIAMVGLEKFKLKQFDNLDFPAKPRWPLDEKAEFLKGAGIKL